MEKILNEINEVFAAFQKNAELNVAGNKSAGTRARAAAMKLRNLLKEYRVQGIANDKKPAEDNA